MSLDFEKYANKGNELINQLASDLEIPRDKAGRIIVAVLHAFRNRLTYEESFQLMAQLPMALKGVYVNGWKFNQPFQRINHVTEFLDEVRQEDGGLAGYDFGNDTSTRNAVAAVFRVLDAYVSEGEMNDIIDIMPAEMKNFIKESIANKRSIL